MEKVRINHGRKRKWGGGVAGLAIVPHEKGVHREGGGYGTAKGSRVIRAC